MTLRLIVGLARTAVAFRVAGKRLLMPYRLGQHKLLNQTGLVSQLRSVRATGAATSAPSAASHPEGNLP